MLPFKLAAAALAALALTPLAVQAAEIRKFDAAGFAAAKREGRPILVDVKAWWCPVCASQNSTIRKAIAAPDFDKLLILEVNYDKQKPEWQALGVRKQATLIGYRGAQEVGRIEFDTNKDAIHSLLHRTAG